MARNQQRKGVAAVEAAVCLPLLALIFLGSLEVSGGIFQEYNAQATTFELSKLALSRDTTCDDVQILANQIMPQHGFTNWDVSIVVEARTFNADSVDPPPHTSFNIPKSGSTSKHLDEVPRGTLLRMTLTADRPAVAGFGFTRVFLSNQITSDCVFVKEY